MGTCYSSKSKSASQPYSSAPMSTSSSQDSALRVPRPTPYARASNAGTVAPAEATFKRCIPPPTKYRAAQAAEKYPSQATNLTRLAKSTGPPPPADTPTGRGGRRRGTNDNSASNNSSLNNNNNNNNNFVEGNPIRDFTTFKREVLDRATLDEANNLLEAGTDETPQDGKGEAENIDQVRIQYGTTKIPTKITAHLSGLPKPQVAVVTNRVSATAVPQPPLRDSNEKLTSPVGNLNVEKSACVHRVSPDKESISDRSHSGDSGSTDYDSGLGHSFSDHLASIEHFGKRRSSSMTLHEECSPELERPDDAVDSEIPPAPTVPKPLPADRKTSVDGATPKMGIYDQPDSYAAYRGILSYRRIPPLKKCVDQPQWKSLGEHKDPKPRESPARAVIAKGILAKGPKAVHSATKEHESVDSLPSKSVPSAQLSPTKEEKEMQQEGLGFLSPSSDGFLIDDDIADQPGLIALERTKGRATPSVKRSIFELHALQSFSGRQGRRDRSSFDDHYPLCSDHGSSCSSLGSDDLMLDFDAPSKDGNESTCSPGVKYSTTPLRRLSRGSAAHHAEKRNSWESNHSDEGASLRRASESVVSRWVLKTPLAAGGVEGRPRTISLPLRPPRQMVMQECDDGGIKLDSSSYRSVCQDLNGVKTMLLKLKRVLQDAETLNPFDVTNTKNFFYHALANSDPPAGFTSTPTGDTPEFHHLDTSELLQARMLIPLFPFIENIDLKRQLILRQQQLEDKDRTIHLLQQQMTKYMNIASTEKEPGRANAAVQTERPKFLQNVSSSSNDSSSGRLVSSKVKSSFEEHLKANSVCHASFQNKMEDVSKSLCNITQALRLQGSKPHQLNRSHSNWELLS
ncbi:unnamed protein product [Ixodes hexagonus]